MRKLSKKKREELEAALELVQVTQTELWDAMSELEGLLIGVELDAETDMENYDVDTLLEMEEDALLKKGRA